MTPRHLLLKQRKPVMNLSIFSPAQPEKMLTIKKMFASHLLRNIPRIKKPLPLKMLMSPLKLSINSQMKSSTKRMQT
jgi:hypothetical protein